MSQGPTVNAMVVEFCSNLFTNNSHDVVILPIQCQFILLTDVHNSMHSILVSFDDIKTIF